MTNEQRLVWEWRMKEKGMNDKLIVACNGP